LTPQPRDIVKAGGLADSSGEAGAPDTILGFPVAPVKEAAELLSLSSDSEISLEGYAEAAALFLRALGRDLCASFFAKPGAEHGSTSEYRRHTESVPLAALEESFLRARKCV
jgi:hypothetical protein